MLRGGLLRIGRGIHGVFVRMVVLVLVFVLVVVLVVVLVFVLVLVLVFLCFCACVCRFSNIQLPGIEPV